MKIDDSALCRVITLDRKSINVLLEKTVKTNIASVRYDLDAKMSYPRLHFVRNHIIIILRHSGIA